MRLQGIMVVVYSSKQISRSRCWMQLPWFPAGTSHYKTRLQGIMVVLFNKTNIQSKMMNATTMIFCRHILQKKLAIWKAHPLNLCSIFCRNVPFTHIVLEAILKAEMVYKSLNGLHLAQIPPLSRWWSSLASHPIICPRNSLSGVTWLLLTICAILRICLLFPCYYSLTN